MGKIYFLLGGARSGKSQYSEKLASSISKNVGYLATAEIIDAEMAKRIELHRESRPDSWMTFEIGKNDVRIETIDSIISRAADLKLDVLLIDCITILLFRLVYRPSFDSLVVLDNTIELELENNVEEFFKRFIDIIRSASASPGLNLIIVSNEVGLGVVPPYPFGRIFRDMLGMVNRKIAEASDEVYFFVAGLNLKMK